MDKRKILVSVIICICILLTACSEAAKEADDNAAAGVSGSAVSGAAVSGAAVSGAAVSDMAGTTVRPEELPDKWMAKGYLMDVAFRIKERTAEGYRATVEIEDFWGVDAEGPNWEICLELEDEIIELSEAEIVSQEGMLYTIRGTGKNTDYIWGDAEDGIRFDITVRCPEGAHEPGICYMKRDDVYVPEKDYKFEVLELEEEGTKVHGTLRFTNCSRKSLEHWKFEIGSNFQMKLLNGARVYDEYDHEIEKDDYVIESQDDKDYYDRLYDEDDTFYYETIFSNGEKIWCYDICGRGEKCSLQKGESVEISFTGKRAEGKPKVSGARNVMAGKDTDINWGIIEMQYGAKYGKIEKYLVADSVAGGVDLFFVFDEKRNDSYTATAELTNVLNEGAILPKEKAHPKRMLEIADWEISLECEDTIEEIKGAKIVAHEGNVYHIRAARKNKWISGYGMETFQVKVSCEGQIHHLGEVHLVKAKYRGRGISSGDKRQELNVMDKNLFEPFGTSWWTYQELYEDWEITYYDPDELFESQAEEDAFYKRRKWGKKMGR